MNKVIVGNTTDELKISNVSVRRLMAVIRWNTTNPVNLPDLNKIILRAELERGNKKIQLFNASLNVLFRHCMFFNGMEQGIDPATYAIVPATNFRLIPITLDLGKIINLKGSDEITLYVQQLDGWVGTSGLAATSNITYTWREDIGNEVAIPTIKTIPIQSQSSEFSANLKNDVTEISVISTLAGSPTDSTKQLDSFTIISDKYNVSDTMDRLLARRLTQFESFLDAMNRGHSFKYVPNMEIDDCRIDMKCVSANVASGTLWLVYNQDEQDQLTYQRASKRHEKHSQKNQAKYFQQ